jgi:hypothetical protein
MLAYRSRFVHIAVVVISALLFWMCGCQGDGMHPTKPNVMTEKPTVQGSYALLPYTIAEYLQDKKSYSDAIQTASAEYNKRIAAGNLPKDEERVQIYAGARVYRDVMINRIRADIRDNYGQFEEMLNTNRATWETGADFAELALAAATTISGGEQAKTVLAAILTAVKGGRLSVDKNFFREKTTDAIVSALRSARTKQDTVIIGKMAQLGPEQYTFEEAWNDLVDLYYAGTLTSGFQVLAEQAATDAKQAEKAKTDVEVKRANILAATQTEIDLAGHLYGALLKMTPKDARAILKAANEPDPGTDEAAKAALGNALQGTDPGDPKYKKFEKAYNDVLGTGKW